MDNLVVSEGVPMNDDWRAEPVKTRIAVGIFTRPESLAGALDAFARQKDPGALLLLVGGYPALKSCLAGVMDLPATSLPPLCLVGDNCGDGLPPALARLARLEGWIEPRLALGLRAHVDRGACLLLARAEPPELEARVCAVLVSHCDGPVQVHDTVI